MAASPTRDPELRVSRRRHMRGSGTAIKFRRDRLSRHGNTAGEVRLNPDRLLRQRCEMAGLSPPSSA
jgi:hypothetical protein